MYGTFTNIGHAVSVSQTSQPAVVYTIPQHSATIKNDSPTKNDINRIDTDIKIIKENVSALLKYLESIPEPKTPVVNVYPEISIPESKVNVVHSTYTHELLFDIIQTAILFSGLALGVAWKFL